MAGMEMLYANIKDGFLGALSLNHGNGVPQCLPARPAVPLPICARPLFTRMGMCIVLAAADMSCCCLWCAALCAQRPSCGATARGF